MNSCVSLKVNIFLNNTTLLNSQDLTYVQEINMHYYYKYII